MNALQIKCYLLPESEQLVADLIAKSNEIRRFVLAQGLEGGSYEQLLAKIKGSFGSSLIKSEDQIKTYYLDEENEFVCFSSDAELQYAVDLQTAIKMSSKPYETAQNFANGLFKVFVVVRPKATNDKQDQNGEWQHPGVVCDGCEQAIFGIRYKCMMCPDYDLCRDCREKGVHAEHTFIPITKPARRCPGMFFGKHKGHGHGWKHRFNHHYQHQHHHHQQQQQQQQTGEAAGNRGQNPLQETLNNFLPFIANSIPIVNDPEQLKSVGEYLKQFFDPFGIDVSYYVDNINNMRNPTTSTATDAKAAAAKADEAKTAESQPAENLMETTSDLDAKTTLGSEILVPTVESETTATASTSSIKVTPLVPSAPVKQDLIDLKTKEDTMTETMSPSPFEFAASALKNVIEKSQANEEHVTSGAMGVSSPTTSVKTTRNQDDTNEDGFNLVDIEKELKFINCIEQLRSMGYNDDAGWLTRLVIAKEGNINAVLDSLHPSKN